MGSYQHLSREDREEIAVLRVASLLRPCRGHFWEALLVHFGLAPQTCRRSALGQTATFSTAWRCVWNAVVNRPSGLSVGYAAVTGPRM